MSFSVLYYINQSIKVLKLLKMASGIRSLLDTVIQALPQVGNLALLFFLLFFIFAALGVELFGRLSTTFFTYSLSNAFLTECNFKQLIRLRKQQKFMRWPQ